ncbi:SDR family oxidoreductase [Pseudoalteromonas piscicida]|uniref:dTDP-4-dehydrorhamnose reductase family protein n=1 Tax=Pseudoalteromonas piscicida TaxID=43662 RepID=UPI0030A31511
MSTVMITGATGLLGRALCQELSRDHEIIGCGFSRAVAPLHKLDLGNHTEVIEFLDTHTPDVLIHAAAERRPEQCEHDQEATLALNVAATEFLAAACKARHIRFIFISTDYVFDGTSAPYAENAVTNPVNFYGKTKQAAERAIAANSSAHTIVRVPVLYGEVLTLAESAVTVIAKQLLADPASCQDHWAVRYPTHVNDIALTLNDLLQHPDTTGVIHISGDQALTKYEMALVMADVLQLPTEKIIPLSQPSTDATRPKDCALQDTKLRQLNISHQRDFATAIREVLGKHIN